MPMIHPDGSSLLLAGNGLLHNWCQAITLTNWLISVRPLGTNLNDIWIKVHYFSLTKMHFKMLSVNCLPFCLGLDVVMCKSVVPLYVILDSFTVPLHSPNNRHLPAVRAVQRDCHWSLKNGGNSHWSREPITQWGTRQSQSIFRPTNHKGWCQRIEGHVSYPTGSPIATGFGLCSSPMSHSTCPMFQGGYNLISISESMATCTSVMLGDQCPEVEVSYPWPQ